MPVSALQIAAKARGLWLTDLGGSALYVINPRSMTILGSAVRHADIMEIINREKILPAPGRFARFVARVRGTFGL